MRDKEMAENLDRITGDYNDFWAERDYLHDLARFPLPVKKLTGFLAGMRDSLRL